MKINVVQIILGLAILAAMTLSIAWDPTGFYVSYVSLQDASHSLKTIFNPDTREVVATVLAYLVLLLGLAISAVSAVLMRAKNRAGYVTPDYRTNLMVKQLAVTQIGLGFAAAVSAFLVTIWGFPTSYTYKLSGTFMQVVNFTPGARFVWALELSGLVFLLSLVVLGFSIAQQIAICRQKTKVISNQESKPI
jgi:hypothetical protein